MTVTGMALIIIWIVNLIVSIVLTFFWHKKTNGNRSICLMFIALPVLGLILFWLPVIMYREKDELAYDRETLVQRNRMERQESKVSLKRELDIVPVKDAMVISSDKDKRELLLNQLKKNLDTNYKEVLIANNDEDSESAHYAASAKMEVARRLNEELNNIRGRVDDNSQDINLVHTYLKKMCDYIESGIMSAKEAQIYKKQYCRIYADVMRIEKKVKENDEAQAYLSYLVDLEDYEEAEYFWANIEQKNKSEEMYFDIMEMYYDMKEKNKFFLTMEQLEKSGISLSADGLATLRYWRNRR